MSLLASLRDTNAPRSKSARKLAEYVLHHPAAVLSMSIANLAAAVGVSEPTVNRFCTGLGLKGFPDFKLKLAAELARVESRMARDITAKDSLSQVVSKVFDSTYASLASAQEHLDHDALEQAVAWLASARSIVICGLGASASVAIDAGHKLLRFDTPVTVHTDIINQRMIAAGMDSRDCLLCISYTGRTSAMVALAELGNNSGARVIGLTAPGSPLADHCQLALAVVGREDTTIYTPMTSRIAQLVIIDVLATRLAQRKGPQFDARLRRVKQSLIATREPPPQRA
jgi:RpiR family carbohydrate utilization transcriptional regulator